jgi:hypothetical protein
MPEFTEGSLGQRSIGGGPVGINQGGQELLGVLPVSATLAKEPDKKPYETQQVY